MIETYRAFLLPLLSSQPGQITINYDAILPSTRKPLAKTIKSCLKAMEDIKKDLTSWGEKVRLSTSRHMEGEIGVGQGVSGDLSRESMKGIMEKEVLLVAITPTKQEMRSSVGREVSLDVINFWMNADRRIVSYGSVPYTLYIISR